MKKKKVVVSTLMSILLLFIIWPLSSAEASRSFTGQRYLERDNILVADPDNPQEGVPSSGPGIVSPPTSETPSTAFGEYSRYPAASRSGSLNQRTYVPLFPPSEPVSPGGGSPAMPPSAGDLPPAELPALPEPPSWLTPEEARAFELLNEARVKNNVPPVQIHPGLVELARLKAQDMVENDYFGHISPTYGSAANMAREAGIRYTIIGENLSKAGNIFQAHLQLEYSSKGHREIMLNPRYNYVGVGVARLTKVPGIVLVEIFIN